MVATGCRRADAGGETKKNTQRKMQGESRAEGASEREAGTVRTQALYLCVLTAGKTG
jgi:hypothetical protein